MLPCSLASLAACDIVTADLRSEETAQWHKTYQLDANGRVEISNVNGKIEVEPSAGNTVDVTALKKARGASPEAAKAALERATIVEDVSSGRIKIETKMANMSGIVFNGGNVQVEYRVKVPAGAEVKFTTTNGGIEIDRAAGTDHRRDHQRRRRHARRRRAARGQHHERRPRHRHVARAGRRREARTSSTAA